MGKAEADEQVGMVQDVLNQDGIPKVSVSDSGSDDDTEYINPQHYCSFAPGTGITVTHLLFDNPHQPQADDTDSAVGTNNHFSDPILSSMDICLQLSSDPDIPCTSSTIDDTANQSPHH